ncbi:MAG: AMP-binding protein [Caldilineaceae bacterium]|nr:AMP-binding protein [Caldilineaceae bacterium]
MNLHALFAIAAQRNPRKVALHYAADGVTTTLTYAELYTAVDRLAVGLQQWGLHKGDRVAFFLGNRPEFVIAYLAVIKLGAVMVPVNLRYRRLEIGHIVADCAPRLVVTEREQLPVLEDAGHPQAGDLPLLVVEELAAWSSDAPLSVPLVVAEDLAVIMYTSGTTGRSKGAMLLHSNLLATITGLLAAWAWQADDTLLLCLPIFHTHGLVVGLHCALAAGATTLLRAKFEANVTLQEILSGKPTLFFAVPTIYVRLVEELRSAKPVDLHHMRLFCSGSAPLAAETFTAFQELTGHTILERYGMTETGMNLSNPYVGARVPGSVGTPLPGVMMRIVDKRHQDVKPGEEGELLVRGSNVFSGYWNAPEKTAESFSHDTLGQQWFHTGDIARQDAETGYVTLLGRRHELIISGGFNIYPREIEELLVTIPGIAEAAVVGVPHAEWGEVPVAYVVCTSEVDDNGLALFCRQQLASFKVPKQFHHVETLPRNAMGKLQKHLLK